MAYVKGVWVDDDGSGTTGTPVTKARMDNIEQGVADAHAFVADLWHPMAGGYLNGWTDSVAGTETGAYRLILPSVVAFKGTIKGGNYGTAVFNIPAGYRPTSNRRLTINCLDAGTRRVALLYVDTGGGVYVYSETGAPNPSSEANIEAVMVL